MMLRTAETVAETGQAPATERVAALFDAEQAHLYRLARRMARDAEDARDLVQETFLRVAARPAKIPADADGARAWLTRILVNLCRDRSRRLVVRHRTPDEYLPQPAPEQDPEAAAVARTTVQAALERLSPRRRAVIVLHELEGLATKRIAEMLGLSQVTVRWHLSSGRRQLAAILKENPS